MGVGGASAAVAAPSPPPRACSADGRAVAQVRAPVTQHKRMHSCCAARAAPHGADHAAPRPHRTPAAPFGLPDAPRAPQQANRVALGTLITTQSGARALHAWAAWAPGRPQGRRGCLARRGALGAMLEHRCNALATGPRLGRGWAPTDLGHQPRGAKLTTSTPDRGPFLRAKAPQGPPTRRRTAAAPATHAHMHGMVLDGP